MTVARAVITERIRPLVAVLAVTALTPSLEGCGDAPPTEPSPTVEAVEVRSSGVVVPALDQAVTLEAVALDVEGDELANQPTDFTWRSTNQTVATVDGTGTVTSRATGQVTIVAELDGAAGHALVTVIQPASRPVSGWDRPFSPTSERLKDIWGSAPDDVWAVGFDGTILHFDGIAWAEVATPTELDLDAIWGSGPEDVWAVGGTSRGGVTLHFDGTEWSDVPNPAEVALDGVWGSGPQDVWAVQGLGRIFHFDGIEWTEVPSPVERLNAIWGSGPEDVWAVGGFFGKSIIVHYDGTEWTEVPNPGEATLFGVWGSGPDDVWAVGDDLILHYDGQWNAVIDPPPTRLFDLWGSGPNDIWAVAVRGGTYHNNGTAWDGVGIPAGGTLFGVWEMTPGDLWVVGLDGEILRGMR